MTIVRMRLCHAVIEVCYNSVWVQGGVEVYLTTLVCIDGAS